MRIAIFDYHISRTNAVGGCHLRMLNALAHEHDFTVFSVTFDNPCPDRIKWVRVPAPRRPLALLFVAYHVLAALLYWLHRLKTRERFDVIQSIETNLSFATVAYTHFCHTSYLKQHWAASKGSGLRGILRWLDHRLHASLESRVYSSIQHIVVPSRGLADEIRQAFPDAFKKIRVLPNAVDVERLPRPESFDRRSFRAHLGIEQDAIVFVFAALGHFERKGLPMLLQAFAKVANTRAKLMVVGGSSDLIASYRHRVEDQGLAQRLIFAGMQADVRPFLWASDAFLFASSYETFSLTAFEAAAASLPLLAPRLHGVEEIISEGVTGYIVRRDVDEFVWAIHKFISLTTDQRAEMGRNARSAALRYNEQAFVTNWRRFYSALAGEQTSTSVAEPIAESIGTLS